MSYIVRIPEPCNEDWNKMNPAATGRHCTVCSKTVIDFSNKTDMEIHSILQENSDKKVCGHFKKTQIDRPLRISIPWHLIPGNVSSTKTFAMAVFFVFGTFLFSCTNYSGRTVGEIGIENREMLMGAVPLTFQEDTIKTDSVKIDTLETLDGEMQIERVEVMVNGGIGYYKEELLIPDTIVETTIEPLIDNMVGQTLAGAVAYVVDPTTEIIPTTVSDSNSDLEKRHDMTLVHENTAILFPNPSSGEFTIQYEVKQKGIVQIDIYDINGALVKNVINNQTQHTGKYVLPTTLKDVANGIYICSIVVNGKKTTERIVIEK
ncbi:MAG: T9SS type A sorting domain-containing protein [Bacteroidota bacterium]|nr:T9SS type A sorting domain-containing protein [Bacteroidota bacterium]